MAELCHPFLWSVNLFVSHLISFWIASPVSSQMWRSSSLLFFNLQSIYIGSETSPQVWDQLPTEVMHVRSIKVPRFHYGRPHPSIPLILKVLKTFNSSGNVRDLRLIFVPPESGPDPNIRFDRRLELLSEHRLVSECAQQINVFQNVTTLELACVDLIGWRDTLAKVINGLPHLKSVCLWSTPSNQDRSEEDKKLGMALASRKNLKRLHLDIEVGISNWHNLEWKAQLTHLNIGYVQPVDTHPLLHLAHVFAPTLFIFTVIFQSARWVDAVFDVYAEDEEEPYIESGSDFRVLEEVQIHGTYNDCREFMRYLLRAPEVKYFYVPAESIMLYGVGKALLGTDEETLIRLDDILLRETGWPCRRVWLISPLLLGCLIHGSL